MWGGLSGAPHCSGSLLSIRNSPRPSGHDAPLEDLVRRTGVDRAALDAAIAAGILYGGWCPKGGWAEDLSRPPGLLAAYPQLQETPQTEPMQRTEWNVRDADRLMVLIDRAGLQVSKGSEAACGFAAMMGKPHIVLDLDADDALPLARAFLAPVSAERRRTEHGETCAPWERFWSTPRVW